MENKRETFYEDYQFFKKNYSHWKLFLKPKGKIGVSKYYDRLVIAFVVLMFIGIILEICNVYSWLVLSFLFLSVFLFITANIIDLIKIRKQLKSDGLPLPSKGVFYTWRSEDLENERIRIIHKEYQDVSDAIIEERINLASYSVEQYSQTPDLSVLKVIEFFAKQFYLITVGILMFLLKAKIDFQNLKIFYKWFFLILLVCITLAVLWNLLVKRSLVDNRLVKVKSLTDYILVLKNILLLRKVKDSKN